MGIGTSAVIQVVGGTWWACRIAKRMDHAVRGEAYVMDVWDGGRTMQGRELSVGATRALLGLDLFGLTMAIALFGRLLPFDPTKVALVVALVVLAVAERVLATSPTAPDLASLALPAMDRASLDRSVAQLDARRRLLPAAMALRASVGLLPLAVALGMPDSVRAAAIATLAGLAAGALAMLAFGGTLVPIARIVRAVDRRAEAPSPQAIWLGLFTPFASLVRPAFDVHALFARTSPQGRPPPTATVVAWWGAWLLHHVVVLVLPITSPRLSAGTSALALQALLTVVYAASTVHLVGELSSLSRALADDARIRQATTAFG